MTLAWISVAWGLTLAIGCAADRTVTAGRYVGSNPAETVTVDDSKIVFAIKIGSGEIHPIVTREYDYTVNSDDRIQPYPMTSVDAGLGIGRFDWWWDGDVIVREDPRTGEKDRFVRETEPTP